METCENCGVEFDRWDAEYEFHNGINASFMTSYDQLGKTLCGACAVEAYNNGNYYETCESCGKQFNPEEDKYSFESQVSDRVMGAEMDEFGILCADCAARALLNSLPDCCEDDDDESGESLDVRDAALIWASHGKDEDYSFGFSEEELEEALS